MQPAPTAYRLQLDGDNVGQRVEAGKLSFACVKGKFMMYEQQIVDLPSGKKLYTWGAFAELPNEYLKPDAIDHNTITLTFDGRKKGGKKHIVITAFADDELAPVQVASYDVAASAMAESPITSFHGSDSFDVDVKEAHILQHFTSNIQTNIAWADIHTAQNSSHACLVKLRGMRTRAHMRETSHLCVAPSWMYVKYKLGNCGGRRRASQ